MLEHASARLARRSRETATFDDSGRLAVLPWFPFPVVVSEHARGAGERIAQRALAAYEFVEDALRITPQLSLAILAREDWAAHAGSAAYGVMHVRDDGELVAGIEAADAWHSVSDFFARELPAPALAQLTAVHGVDAQNGRGPALDGVAETLIAHEIAHLAAAQAGVTFPRRWLDEAFANYALVAVLGESDPQGMRCLGSLAEAAASLDNAMPTLAQFEAGFGRMDVATSVLAELAITRGVYDAYASSDTGPLARLLGAFADARARHDADGELASMLARRVHPAIAAIPERFAPVRGASPGA